jgi:septal ring factor EnvC (AmiA/AmiB activator)
MVLRIKYTIIVLGVFTITAYVQNNTKKNDIKQKLESTKKEIEKSNKILNEVRKNKKVSVSKMILLDKRINLRKEIITDIENETEILEEKINDKRKVIEIMNDDLKNIKKEYGIILYNTYKNYKSYRRIMYLLSSKDLNQVFKRYKYLQQYSDYRKKQAEILKGLKEIIKEEVLLLSNTTKKNNLLINQKKEENNKLEQEKDIRKKAYNKLNKKEKKLVDEITKKERIKKQLEETIRRIIEEEARKNAGRNLYERLTPEEKIISDNFGKNRGKLPWPTKRGSITTGFGIIDHPEIRGTKINSNGVDIETVKGETARCLFEGVVSKIVAIKGANNTVIIRHGNYLTVYQNLVNVKVKVGEIVKIKEEIGDVYYDENENKSVIHLEIWHELNKMNPEIWLSQIKK